VDHKFKFLVFYLKYSECLKYRPTIYRPEFQMLIKFLFFMKFGTFVENDIFNL